MGGPQDIGERFLDAWLARDFAGLGVHLHPRVQMRALRPGRAIVRMGAGPVVEQCRSWFGPWDRFTMLDRNATVVVTRVRLAYHLAVSKSSDLPEVAHQMFIDAVDDRINVIDLLDSGFLPYSGQHRDPTNFHSRGAGVMTSVETADPAHPVTLIAMG